MKEKSHITQDLGKNDPVHQLVLITRERDEFKRKFEHEKKKLSLINNFGEKSTHRKDTNGPASQDEDTIRKLRAELKLRESELLAATANHDQYLEKVENVNRDLVLNLRSENKKLREDKQNLLHKLSSSLRNRPSVDSHSMHTH